MQLTKLSPDNIYLISRGSTAELCRRSLWMFCKTLAPDFYKESRPHLKTLCDTLQNFYENKLLKDDGTPYIDLMIEMPPRHGKSRTLCMFEAWILGLEHKNKIVTASFNDDLAQDFSRNVRDMIAAEKIINDDWCYSDIFPNTKVAQGNASYEKWALEGEFFNYKGCGIGAMITGRGGNLLVVDDAVRDAEMAYNESALDKVWRWYTGTFMSRGEHAKTIICGTPWASKDLGGRLLAKEPEQWYKLSMPACTDGKMLCDEILTYAEYQRIKDSGDDVKTVVAANYDLVRVDVEGALYGAELLTYKELPEKIERRGGYVDTADEGEDYLCAIAGVKCGVDYPVTNLVYTQSPQEVTERQVSDMIESSGMKEICIESNNGGRAFARNVEAMIRQDNYTCAINWFHQSQNKNARILTNAANVKQHIYFPENWNKRWPDFYLAMISYQRMGKNKHDDAPDAVTGIVETYLEQTIRVDDRLADSARRARMAGM